MKQTLNNLNSYCWQLHCLGKNPVENLFCKSCGSSLWLAKRYQAVKILGQGGNSRTFLAFDQDSLCVIKQFWGKDTRFYSCQQIEQGYSPQIPRCLHQFDLDGIGYYVQEYIKGENLASILASKITFNGEEICQILASLLPVIDLLHHGGIIHGDIKPANIICPVKLDFSQLVLVDLGLVEVPGDPAFAAPEQLKGELVFASDLFSLGVTCIYLLTAIHPFRLFDSTNQQWCWQQYWLSAQDNLPLVAFLDRLIAPNLKDRWSSAEEAIKEFSTMSPRSPRIPVKSPKWECYATLTGHSGLVAHVNAVAIANNGKKIASGSDDQTIRLWDVETATEGLILRGHGKSVKSVAFHPHEPNILVSGSPDYTIKLWTCQDSRCNQVLTGHTKAVNVVRFSPKGDRIASGSADKSINLWCWPTGELITTIKSHHLSVNTLAFSPKQAILVSGSSDSTVKLWDLTTFELIATLTEHTASVQAVAISPNGQWLATGGEDRTIRLWDLVSQHCVMTFSGHPWPISSLSFSDDGQILISGSWDKTIKLWEISTGKEIARLTGHTDSVTCVAINQGMIVSGSNDKTIKIWRFSY
jgi:WD40 repeat protein